MGLTHNFHGKKKGGVEILNFLRSEGGDLKNFARYFFFHYNIMYICIGTQMC